MPVTLPSWTCLSAKKSLSCAETPDAQTTLRQAAPLGRDRIAGKREGKNMNRPQCKKRARKINCGTPAACAKVRAYDGQPYAHQPAVVDDCHLRAGTDLVYLVLQRPHAFGRMGSDHVGKIYGRTLTATELQRTERQAAHRGGTGARAPDAARDLRRRRPELGGPQQSGDPARSGEDEHLSDRRRGGRRRNEAGGLPRSQRRSSTPTEATRSWRDRLIPNGFSANQLDELVRRGPANREAAGNHRCAGGGQPPGGSPGPTSNITPRRKPA